MPTSRLDGLGRAIRELDDACIATLRLWSRHLWTEIRESAVDEDDREAARRFSSGYALVRSIVIGILAIIFSGIFLLAALGLGIAIWRNIPLHQVEWLHTDSPLVRPLAVGAYTLVLILWIVPYFQVPSFRRLTAQEKFQMKNEARKTLAQICGGAILLTGLYASFRTMDVSHEGQINDLYVKAVEEIDATDVNGKPKIEVRIGGMYALSKIGTDSKELFIPSINIIKTYVQTHLPVRSENTKPKPATPDVQAGLNVLSMPPYQILSVRNFDLRGYRLSASVFAYADFTGADLRGVNFEHSDLRNAQVDNADFRDAVLADTDVSGVDFRLTNITQDQIDTMNGDATTKIPSRLKIPGKWHTRQEAVAKGQ